MHDGDSGEQADLEQEKEIILQARKIETTWICLGTVEIFCRRHRDDSGRRDRKIGF